MARRDAATTRKRGSALLMVLAVLAILSVLGLTFAMLARLDQKAGGSFAESVRTQNVAPPARGVDFVREILQTSDERLPNGTLAYYDGVAHTNADDTHKWLAGVISEYSTAWNAWRLSSFRGDLTVPAELAPHFNVIGGARVYDGIHGSDLDRDGIEDGATLARTVQLLTADTYNDLRFGRYLPGAGFNATDHRFENPLDEGSAARVEVAAIVLDLESRLNVNAIGNTSAGMDSHGFALGWGPHEIGLCPIGSDFTALGGSWWNPVRFDSWNAPAPAPIMTTTGAAVEYLLVRGACDTTTQLPGEYPYYGRTGSSGEAGTADTDDDAAELPDPSADWIDNDGDGVPDVAYIRDGGNADIQSTRSGDDTWYDGSTVVFVSRPLIQRYGVCILAGSNGILESTRGGDDEVIGCIIDGGNAVANSTRSGDDVGPTATGATVPADSVVVSPGFDGVLQSTAGADDYVGGLDELVDEPDEVSMYLARGDDAPFGIEDELALNAGEPYPNEYENAADADTDISPGVHLAKLFSYHWAGQLRADLSGDGDDNNANRQADEVADLAAAGQPFTQSAYQLGDGRDNNGNQLIDNPAEGDDAVARRMFTGVSCGTVWTRRATSAGGSEYPIGTFLNSAGSVYELCKIPVNRVGWGKDFTSAAVTLDSTGDNTARLLRDLYNAAWHEQGGAPAQAIDAAGLVANLIDAFDRHDDGADPFVQLNEGITALIIDTGGSPAAPRVCEVLLGGDNTDGNGDTDRADRETFFATLNTAIDDSNDEVVFGLEDRVPRITQIHYTEPDVGTANDEHYAIEIYNPAPFEEVDLLHWQLAVFNTGGTRLRYYSFDNGDLLPQRDQNTDGNGAHNGTFVIGNNAYAIANPTGTDINWSVAAGAPSDLRFGDGEYVVLVRRFADSSVNKGTGTDGDLDRTGDSIDYHGVVIDAARVPTLRATNGTDNFSRYRGWRCDQWDDAGEVMKEPPAVDDTYPKSTRYKLQLYFPDDPTTKMPNLGIFGRIIDFQLPVYVDSDSGEDTISPAPGTTGEDLAFSRNLAVSIEDVASPTWDERWAVFYQYFDRDVTGGAKNGSWRDPTALGGLMDLVTIPAPHADGIDNDGDGATDAADTGVQNNDRHGPEVRLPGQINVNTASLDVLACLASVLELDRYSPATTDNWLQAVQTAIADRPFQSFSDLLDKTAGGGTGPRIDFSTMNVEDNNADDDGDGYVDEPGEELYLRGRISNLVTTRSNTFLAYVASRYVDEGARRMGIVAGPDRDCDTTATDDDVQVFAVGTTGLSPGTVVVGVGPNGILDTLPVVTSVPPDLSDADVQNVGINEPLEGGDGIANTTANAADIQVIDVGDIAPPGACVVAPGADGVLSTTPSGDERGYGVVIMTWTAVDATCDVTAVDDDVQVVANGDAAVAGQVVILPGPDGYLNSDYATGSDTAALQPVGAMAIREPLTGGNSLCNTTAAGDDIQVVPVGTAALAGQILILPGPNGRLDTQPAADDQYDYTRIFDFDDTVHVLRELLILDRAACARSGAVWTPRVEILGRKVLSEYSKAPE